MTQSHKPITSKNAFAVHFLMVMTITGIAAACWVIRDLVSVDVGPTASRMLRYAAVFELVASGLIIGRIRQATSLMRDADDVDAWWSANGARVLTTWVLAYGVGVTGAALWLITDDVLILAGVVLAALLLLMRLAPTRWRDDEPRHQSMLVP